jgi:hypothetical protein
MTFIFVFVLFFVVQLCGSNSGAPRDDSEAAGARDWMQNNGQREGVDAGQEEGQPQRQILRLSYFYSTSSNYNYTHTRPTSVKLTCFS